MSGRKKKAAIDAERAGRRADAIVHAIVARASAGGPRGTHTLSRLSPFVCARGGRERADARRTSSLTLTWAAVGERRVLCAQRA